MRIGIVAPPWVPVPPPGYGGTEAVVDLLARGLAARGHDIHLFTVATSTCPVTCHHLYPDAIAPIGMDVPETAHVMAAYEELVARRVDVIHDHTVLGPLAGPEACAGPVPPVVVTQHGPFTPEVLRVFRVTAARASVVAVSRDQASRADGVPIAAVIPHAVDLDVYRPGAGPVPPAYLAFVGRMSPEKGVDHAIRIARRSGLPLRISAKMRDPDELAYFESVVRPLLPPGTSPPVELRREDRVAMVQGAYALLDPIEWPEPFGLVMAEALAMGTPVIAYRRGAASEIVQHGSTGFLVDDEEEAVAAVPQVAGLDRARCRRAAEQRFSVDRFVRDHEDLYHRVIGHGGQPRPALRPVLSELS